jgi:rubrerythrin
MSRCETATPEQVYARFVEFEEKAAEVYLRLASNFSVKNERLSAFWLDMAAEERRHAELLRFCVAENWFVADLPGEREIDEFSELLQDMLERAVDPELDVSGAFAIAAALEASEVNAIYCRLTIPVHASRYLMMRKIAASPRHHISHLVEAAEAFGVAAGEMKNLETALCRRAL